MELIVGALVVLGFLAILARMLPRDAAGRTMLPRIVDESVGMWALRRLTGRSLLGRPWDDEEEFDIEGATPTGLPGGAGLAGALSVSVAADDRPSDLQAGPVPLAPTWSVVSRAPTRSVPVAAPNAAPAASRAGPARRIRWAPLAHGLVAIAGVAANAIVAIALLNVVLAPRSGAGDVLGVTGRPEITPPGGVVVPSGDEAPPSGIDSSLEPPTGSQRPPLPAGQATAPPVKGPTPTPRTTPRPTARPTATPLATPPTAPTPTPGPTATPTATPAPTGSPTPTPTPTPGPTPTPQPTRIQTPDPTPSA
ncbi:MAG: hypothetical protein H0U52_15930 [Chloroflexi bacterium]|nr:hypothetical protein [Chloroflexota bacterium]